MLLLAAHLGVSKGGSMHSRQSLPHSCQLTISRLLVTLLFKQAGPCGPEAVHIWREVDVARHLAHAKAVSACQLLLLCGSMLTSLCLPSLPRQVQVKLTLHLQQIGGVQWPHGCCVIDNQDGLLRPQHHVQALDVLLSAVALQSASRSAMHGCSENIMQP